MEATSLEDIAWSLEVAKSQVRQMDEGVAQVGSGCTGSYLRAGSSSPFRPLFEHPRSQTGIVAIPAARV